MTSRIERMAERLDTLDKVSELWSEYGAYDMPCTGEAAALLRECEAALDDLVPLAEQHIKPGMDGYAHVAFARALIGD